MRTRVMHNEKGSSSILVILTMLMLVLFGVLGMVSALSEYRIAQKNASWTQNYYQFEAKAQEQVRAIDELILAERTESQLIYKQWNDNGVVTEVLDDALRTKVIDLMQNSNNGKQQTVNALFMILMESKLSAYDPEAIVEAEMGSDKTMLLWTKTIELDSKRRYMVQLDLSPDQNKRFNITIWREIPETFDYSKGMEFEDVEDIGS